MTDPNSPQHEGGSDLDAGSPSGFEAQSTDAQSGQPNYGAPEGQQQPGQFDGGQQQSQFGGQPQQPGQFDGGQQQGQFGGQQQYGQPGQPQPGQYDQAQYGAPGQPQYAQTMPMSPESEKSTGMWAHLSGLGWIIGLGWVGPLVIYLMNKDRSRFVKQEAKEALNFQLFMLILAVAAFIVFGIIGAVLALFTFGLSTLLMFLAYVPPIIGLIFAIVGGVKVNGGGAYRYPFSWRMIK